MSLKLLSEEMLSRSETSGDHYWQAGVAIAEYDKHLKTAQAQAQAGSVTKNQISEAIFGWGLRNDDGYNLSMDDADEIAEYILRQVDQTQSGEGDVTYRCVICNMSGTDDGLCDAHKYEHEGC
jgi:hypothetical protein